MARIVADAAYKMRVSQHFMLFVAAYSLYYKGDETVEIARKAYNLYKIDNIVPEIVTDYCLDVLSGRKAVRHRCERSRGDEIMEATFLGGAGHS